MEFNSCIKVPGTKIETKVATNMQELEACFATFEALVDIADNVFGKTQWSHSVTNQTIDYSDYVKGKHVVGCTTFVRVELKEGIFHEERSYCYVEGPDKGPTIQKAREVSAVDAFKKALQSFGRNVCMEINNIANKKVPSKVNKNPVLPSKENGSAANDFCFAKPCAESTPKPTVIPPELIKFELPSNVEDDFNVNDLAELEAAVGLNPPSTDKVNSPSVKRKVYPKTPAHPVAVEATPATPAGITQEELRQLRKQRQKEKQEEYRKLLEAKKSHT